MERPYILHMFTPTPQVSPFDVNMAADAGYQVLVPYCQVETKAVAGLTQDAIFSRGPKGAARTGIFIGGRDVQQAADMLDAARKAMVPPFVVSLFADPSGSYTTAAALVAMVRSQLRKAHGQDLPGLQVLILGGTGAVGRIAGVLADGAGAKVRLASHRGRDAAQAAADEVNRRFGSTLSGVSTRNSEDLRTALADAQVVLATAAAGAQVLSAAERAAAPKLLVVADVNAVPPAGIEEVGVMDSGKPLSGSKAVSIGALAIGNLKYQVQHKLLERMRTAEKPVVLSFPEAFELAGELLAEPEAK